MFTEENSSESRKRTNWIMGRQNKPPESCLIDVFIQHVSLRLTLISHVYPACDLAITFPHEYEQPQYLMSVTTATVCTE